MKRTWLWLGPFYVVGGADLAQTGPYASNLIRLMDGGILIGGGIKKTVPWQSSARAQCLLKMTEPIIC